MGKSKAPSKHSRAARRAASPSLDLDKSLASAPRVEEPRQRDSVLADRANAGVMKKSSKPKAKTRAQKLRQQKGMERAEAILDQMEIKVSKSLNRGKTVKARRAEWEDLNRKSAKTMFQNLNDEADDDDAMIDDTGAAPSANKKAQPAAVAQNPVQDQHADIDVDDDIS
ncbi:hypothetical protein HFD88_008927 [Aspergillus terreus]|nr:hypothetical protein HFD88_008927 [Aspergillus terreus]